jgi:acyl-CoA thioesterase-1
MNRLLAPITAALAVLATLACGSGGDSAQRPPDQQSAPAPAAQPSRTERAQTRPRIVALGDSLTAGLGLAIEDAYPSLLQKRIDEAGLDYEVVNAGVSGDTSAGGLRRLDWALDGDVRVMIIALGGNDGLRGLPADEVSRNLSAIIEGAQARGISVVLAGMEAPRNFGSAYTRAFHQVYPDLAKRYRVPLVPFLLEGVAGIPAMNQADGIHPTASGARTVAENVWAIVAPIARARATDGRRRSSAGHD